MSYHLGIDLGTTYTGAARFRDGRAEIITLGDRTAVVPSVLYLRDDGDVLAGDPAVRRGISDPTRVVREFKRRMGDPTPIMVGHSPYSADRLMAELLDTVLGVVAQREGGPPESLGITHPANWGPYKKDILEQAIRLADVGEVVVLTEPEAAAIHYAWTERIEPGEIVGVYDLGGGTFDAAVLRKVEGERQFEILGEAEGIERLGGVDFDEAVYQYVVRFLGTAMTGLDPSDPAVVQGVARLRQECVEAKEALSADSDVSIPVFLPTVQTEVRLTRPEFEAMIRPAIAETIVALRRALRGASVEPEHLSAVLLVGGSSRIPLVSQLVTAELGRPTALDVHPKHTVALGAAIAAFHASEGSAGGRLEDTVAAQALVVDAEPHEAVLAPTGSEGSSVVTGETRALSLVRNQDPANGAVDLLDSGSTAGFTRPPERSIVEGSATREAVDPTDDSGSFGSGGSPPQPARRAPMARWAGAAATVVLLVGGIWMFGQGNGAAPASTTVPAQESTTSMSESTTTTTLERTTTTAIDPIEVRDPEPMQVIDSVGAEGAPVFEAAASASEPLGTLPGLTTFTTSGRVESVDGVEWFELAEPIEGGWIAYDVTQAIEPGERVTITDITVEEGRYAVSYEANYDPLIGSGDAVHIHFYWDIYETHEAGAGPDAQSWILYDVPSPFTGFAVADRPEGAGQLCATPATASHTVLNDRVFHCMDLPDVESASAATLVPIGIGSGLTIGPCRLGSAAIET